VHKFDHKPESSVACFMCIILDDRMKMDEIGGTYVKHCTNVQLIQIFVSKLDSKRPARQHNHM
jgi:hypothetical protein